jgi:hypothetical protein
VDFNHESTNNIKIPEALTMPSLIQPPDIDTIPQTLHKYGRPALKSTAAIPCFTEHGYWPASCSNVRKPPGPHKGGFIKTQGPDTGLHHDR